VTQISNSFSRNPKPKESSTGIVPDVHLPFGFAFGFQIGKHTARQITTDGNSLVSCGCIVHSFA
jgi:hypothetical protein